MNSVNINQLFCLDSAKDILNILLEECSQGGVTIKTHCEIEKISSLNLEDVIDNNHQK